MINVSVDQDTVHVSMHGTAYRITNPHHTRASHLSRDPLNSH